MNNEQRITGLENEAIRLHERINELVRDTSAMGERIAHIMTRINELEARVNTMSEITKDRIDKLDANIQNLDVRVQRTEND